jgi:hypothetical protein
MAIEAENKPDLSALIDNGVEHFWRVRGRSDQLDYDVKVAQMLRRNGVELPFDLVGEQWLLYVRRYFSDIFSLQDMMSTSFVF